MDSNNNSTQDLPRNGHIALPGNDQRLRTLDPYRTLVMPQSPATMSEESEGLAIPYFILRSMLQWWPVALPAAFLCSAVSAALILLLFQPVYRAEVVLQMAQRVPFLAYETHEPAGKSEEFVQTQIELLRSPWVASAVVGKPEIAELPEIRNNADRVGWLVRRIRVTRHGHSELYSVTFDGPNPENSATVLNALIDEYLQLCAQDDASRTQRVIELLEREKDTRAAEVQRLRESMRSLTKDIVGRAPLTARSAVEGREPTHHPLDALQERLTEAEVNRRLLEAEIMALEELIAKKDVDVPGMAVEFAIEENPQIRDLRALIATKQAILARVETTAARGKKDPAYARVEREIADYEAALQRAMSQSRPRAEQQVKSLASIERRDELTKLKVKLESAVVLEEMLRERYKTQLAGLEQSGNKSLELEFTRSELALEEKVFEMIAERSMALHTESRAPGRVAIRERAEVPTGPVERLPLRNLLLVGMACFCLPFGFAVLWEFAIRRVSDVQQLAPLVDLSVLGEIAYLPVRAPVKGALYRSGRDLKLFEESINSLRVGLVLPEYRQDIKVFAVCSAIHGEGKTSVASQLAVSIARSSEEPTLLIDGDLRSPDQHQIFNVANEPGLAKVLDGLANLDDAIITDWSRHLHILPAGRLHRSPYKLLGGMAFKELIAELRLRYRYIVIDTPPILSAAEALVLAKAADGVLLSTRRNYSREHQVRLAHQRLVASGAHPLGAVFNAVPTSRYAYTYGEYGFAGNSE